MKFLAWIIGIAQASHAGHDHSMLKPSGAFYGIITKPNKAGDKIWNELEVAMNFKPNTVDFKWWIGYPPQVSPIAKQTFECKDVPFTFSADSLEIFLQLSANGCLARINSRIPAGAGLHDPLQMTVDHGSGDLTFSLLGGAISSKIYAADSIPATVPSGQNGLAPAQVRGRRSANSSSNEAADGKSAPVVQNSGAAPSAPTAPMSFANGGTSTTTRGASARLGSVIVSTAAIIFAGLFL